MTTAKCKTCKFFCELVLEGECQCRYNPPKPFLLASQVGQMQVTSVWPGTKPNNWCGRHEVKLAEIEQ